MADFSLGRYRNASPATRRDTRDRFVLPCDSISALKQKMDAKFGQSDINTDIINLKANLTLALVRKRRELNCQIGCASDRASQRKEAVDGLGKGCSIVADVSGIIFPVRRNNAYRLGSLVCRSNDHLGFQNVGPMGPSLTVHTDGTDGADRTGLGRAGPRDRRTGWTHGTDARTRGPSTFCVMDK